MTARDRDTSMDIESGTITGLPPNIPPMSYPIQTSSTLQNQPPASDSTGIMGSIGSLAKLQTFLPTGTWMAYTALQTWAFTIGSPNMVPPPSPPCNSQQRIALLCVTSILSAIAFGLSFIKRFVYDPTGFHVLYPRPDMLEVSSEIKDPVTKISFPHRTNHHKTAWPFVDINNDFVYNDKRGIRAFVFKRGVDVRVKHTTGATSTWRSIFGRQRSYESFRMPPGAAGQTFTIGDTIEVEIDRVVASIPVLKPRWTRITLCPDGTKCYLDFRGRVWEHAVVSLLAFGTLALLSNPIKSCFFPSLADYIASLIQTGMLILLVVISAGFLRDDTVNLGQASPCQLLTEENKDAAQNRSSISVGRPNQRLGDDIPPELKSLVDMVVWMRRTDRTQA
ncbi:hypothetical protein BU17DRAFT_100827 [Hysterangium stoloniferum]|nr:hypothetical protein BU17DRAFT_100827 [Hysterangium stoloniferum]